MKAKALADQYRKALNTYPARKPDKLEKEMLDALDADDLEEAAECAAVLWRRSAYGFGFVNEPTRIALETIEDAIH